MTHCNPYLKRSLDILKKVQYDNKKVPVRPMLSKRKEYPVIVYQVIGESLVTTLDGSAPESIVLSLDVRAVKYEDVDCIAKQVYRRLDGPGSRVSGAFTTVDLYDDVDDVYRRVMTLEVT